MSLCLCGDFALTLLGGEAQVTNGNRQFSIVTALGMGGPRLPGSAGANLKLVGDALIVCSAGRASDAGHIQVNSLPFVPRESALPYPLAIDENLKRQWL